MVKLAEKSKENKENEKPITNKKKKAKMETIIEIDSDDEEDMQPAHHTTEIKSEGNGQHEETTEEEPAKQEEQAKPEEKIRKQKLPSRRETLQQENLLHIHLPNIANRFYITRANHHHPSALFIYTHYIHNRSHDRSYPIICTLSSVGGV